jgi:FtsZ-binding cell division protein ZapB
MTDYTDLIERLRGNDMPWSVKDAADAVEAQAGRIAELRKEADMMHSEYKTARARIAALEAENEELKKAISKPWMGSARAAYLGEKE